MRYKTPHNFQHIDDVRRMGQDALTDSAPYEGSNYKRNREIYVIVPDWEEDPKAVNNTIKTIGYANCKADSLGMDFIINGIILSDQSCEETVKKNREALFTAKDWLKGEWDSDKSIPEIYHFVLGKDTDEIIGDYASDYYGDLLSGGKEPRGKGWNMLMSSLATGRYPDDEVAIIYMDAENEQIRPKQLIAMGLPMYDAESRVKFIKACFDRYHMEDGKRKLGGRVNASAFKPLVNMLNEHGMMPRIRYPLSGEIGIRRDLLWDINVARQFGVEWATLLQLFSSYSDKRIDTEEFIEVYLGLNMDQPLAEGKSESGILKGIGHMADQIMNANNSLIGNAIRKEWESADYFMEEFRKHQKEHTSKWSRKYREDGQPVEITGGLTLDHLNDMSGRRIEKSMNKLYSREKFDGDLMQPMSNVRENIGHSEFDEFQGAMMDMRKKIKD